jgi:hypothetical protein
MRAYERKILFWLLALTLAVLAWSIVSVIRHSFISKAAPALKAQTLKNDD